MWKQTTASLRIQNIYCDKIFHPTYNSENSDLSVDLVPFWHCVFFWLFCRFGVSAFLLLQLSKYLLFLFCSWTCLIEMEMENCSWVRWLGWYPSRRTSYYAPCSRYQSLYRKQVSYITVRSTRILVKEVWLSFSFQLIGNFYKDPVTTVVIHQI